jgi:hypothetical protein
MSEMYLAIMLMKFIEMVQVRLIPWHKHQRAKAKLAGQWGQSKVDEIVNKLFVQDGSIEARISLRQTWDHAGGN